MSSLYKVSSICENCVSNKVQDNLACAPTAFSNTKSRVKNQRARLDKTIIRQSIRRLRATEKRVIYEGRKNWILFHYGSISTYRSQMRRVRKYTNDEEEIWFENEVRHWTFAHAVYVPHGADDEPGECNSNIPLDYKEVIRNDFRTKRAHLAISKTGGAYKHNASSHSRNNKHKKKNKKKKFVPHAGFDMDVIKNLSSVTYDLDGNDSVSCVLPNIPDDKELVFKRIEDFILCATKITLMSDYKLIMLEVLTYIKTFSDRSIVEMACTYIIRLFEDWKEEGERKKEKMKHEAAKNLWEENMSMDMRGKGSLDPEYEAESGVDDFLTMMRQVGDNFTRAKENPVFKKLSYIITACVTLGLCDASKVTWNIGGVRLFSPDVFKKHVDAPSLISAIMDTVVFFIEGGRELFLHGDIGALLFSDKRIRRLNDDFNFLMSNWDHINTGNFEKITAIPETEYSCRLDTTIETVRNLKHIVDKDEQRSLRIMEAQLINIRTQYQTKKTTGGFKEAPFVICIHGESGLGKSVVQERLMTDLLVSLGYDPDPKNITYYNPYDEYDSSLRGNTIGIFMDEVGNTKTELQTKVPYEFLMRANNNAKSTAVMADLELKNKITIEPKVIVMTTNDATIGAYDCSKNPVSVLRRVHAYLHFRVRKEFQKENGRMIDPDKVYAAYGHLPLHVIQDVWECDVYEYVGRPNGINGRPDVPERRYLSDEEGELKGVGYARLLKLLVDKSRINHAQQKMLVENNGKYHKCVKLCKGCDYIEAICQCKNPDVVIQNLQDMSRLGMIPHAGVVSRALPFVRYLANFWLEAKTKAVMLYAWDFPMRIVQWCSPCEYALHLGRQYTLQVEVSRYKLVAHLLLMCGLFAVFTWDIVLLVLFLFCGVALYHAYEMKRIHEEYVRALMTDRIFIDIAKIARSKKIKQAAFASMGVYLLYKFVVNVRKAWSVAEMMKPHGNISPTSLEDILQRDKEKCAYAKVYVDVPPSTCRENDTSTPDQVCNTVFKNLLIFNVPSGDKVRYCNALAIESNVILVPKHMLFWDGALTREMVTFKRHGSDSAGGAFSCKLDHSSVYIVPDQDLALVFVPSSGSFANIARVLPQSVYSGSCKFVYKNRDGTRRQEGATVEPDYVGHSVSAFSGYKTILTEPTHTGLCMGTFVATCKSPHVVCFHLGGTVTKTTIGIAGVLMRQHYDKGLEYLKRDNYVTHGGGDFPTHILDKEILISSEIHHKSPVHYLQDAKNMQIYGSCGGGSTFISRVKPSLISETVTEVFGIENQWGPPPSKPQWKPWWDGVNNFTHGSNGFRPADVKWAREDYIKPLLELMEKDYIREMVTPLLPHQVINGIPGVRFIDKMNFSTSIGPPLTGEKRKYLVPVEIEGYNEPMDFAPEIWSEIERCAEAWRKRQKAYAPIKAVLKDEPTKKTKEKMRVFYSMNIAVQYHLRRLTLGMARLFETHPLISESMVGMNCMSPEWDQWVKYCNADGYDKCFAGDYKAYDTKMPAQLILASFQIFRKLMEVSGNFSEDDFLIFDGLVSEIVYPVVMYNGTLIALSCGHISGNNLTVFVNNICNSLLKRIGFYNIEVKRHGNTYSFRECERGGNYGDDCKSNVNSSRVTSWSMRTYRDFLAEHGMEFTMPDKSAEMVDFMKWEDAEFLKRTDMYLPEIDCIVGKLSEDSIFKSLHSVLKSDVLSDSDHAIATMDGASYEFFAFGRAIYDDRMEKLKIVAARHQLRPTGIFKTYDMRVEEWLLNHRPESLEDTSSNSC